MTKITKMFCVLLLCLFGAKSANATVEQVHATFENPSNTNTTWDGTTRTFTWSTTYYNQLRNIGLPSGDISNYKKLVVDCSIISGEQIRILFYKGGSNLTLYAKDGVNEFIIKDELEAIAPNDYNEYLLACDEICISGNNGAAPGEAVINDVYLETYDMEATQKVYATFENPSNTNTTWDAATRTFTWSTTYYNQLHNIGLPNGDISKYRKLVVDCNIISGERLRIIFNKSGYGVTLYAKDGVNEFIIKDELEAIAPNDYNEYLLACDEICISGNNEAAPGEAIINEIYLETYPQGEKPDIPDIVVEQDPGRPAGDFVDLTAALFNSDNCQLTLGEKIGQGVIVYGDTNKDFYADLSAFSKLTIVATPGLKLVLNLNHEIDVKTSWGDYGEEDDSKYVWIDAEVGEDGIYELDLTQYNPVHLNNIRLPWDNSNKGTVWYLLLTEKAHEYAIVGDFTGGWPSDENPKPDMLMTQSEENADIYTLTIEHFKAEAKTYEYKLRDHYSWFNTYQLPAEGNASYTFEKVGLYTLTFTANIAENTLSVKAVKEAVEVKSLELYGTFPGLSWDKGVSMISDESKPNIWTVTLERVEVEARTYEYKVSANGVWGEYELPEAVNATFTFGTQGYPAGIYNLTFTANVGEHAHTLKLEAVIQSDVVVEDIYTVAGTADLTGYNWDKTQNEMIFNAETGLYTWIAENITVSAVSKPEFKVVKNGQIWYPIGNDNWVITPEHLGAEGIYTITITFNAETTEIGVSGEKTGEIQPVETVYTVAGTVDLTGYDWDATKNIMALNEETGLYEWTAKDITVSSEKQLEFKVVKTTGSSNPIWYPANNWVITADYLGGEGVYTITITFNAENTDIGVTGEKTGDVATGINTVSTDIKNTVIFNMAGQRMMNTGKGLFIVNGKKVVTK